GGGDARVGQVARPGATTDHAHADVVEVLAQALDLLVGVAQLLAQLVVLLAQALEFVRRDSTRVGRSARSGVVVLRRLCRSAGLEDHERTGRQPALLHPLPTRAPAVVVERLGHLVALESGYQ